MVIMMMVMVIIKINDNGDDKLNCRINESNIVGSCAGMSQLEKTF